MIASDLEALAQTHGLSLLGGFHTDARDMSHFPENTQSLLLFGPHVAALLATIHRKPRMERRRSRPYGPLVY